MTQQNRATFGSKLGVIMATVGCAVGLGNIWRFPYMIGQNGGAAFLAIYIICITLLGLPVMLSEFFIGRYTRKNAAGAFKVLAPGTKWSLIGYNGVLASFLILGFYSVVAGWTLEYIMQAVTGSLSDKAPEAFAQDFKLFSTGIFRPIFGPLLFMDSLIIVVSGLRRVLNAIQSMSILFFYYSFMYPFGNFTNASEGLYFLFKPDFSKITSAVVLSAMGQAFFSLSIGMGCLITYSSYFSKDTKMQITALQVTILDTLVAVMADIMIFPAVFSFGIAPTAGPELVFITLPNVFQQLPMGAIWSLVFFLLLALAALTSTISLHEVATAYVHEEYQITRTKAAWFVSGGVMVLGILSSLSIGIWKEYTLFGLTFFDLLDYLTAKIMLPFGGMLICIYLGNRVDRKILKEELTNKGTVPFYFFNTYAFFMKYIAPIAIGMIFLNELGIIQWLMG